jgi:hypothetical protein
MTTEPASACLDVLKVPFETLNVLKGTFETSAAGDPVDVGGSAFAA